MPRGVAILGVGSTVFGKHAERSLVDLAASAGAEAIADAGIDANRISHLFVGNFLGGILFGQELLAPLTANELGLRSVAAIRTEGACSSSAIGLNLAYSLIASGAIDFALVIGVEKMTGAPTEKYTAALGAATDVSVEGAAGLTFPAFWAMVLRRHMYEYGTRREQVAHVAVKNRRNGAKNDKAQFREPVIIEDVLQSRLISDPIRRLDCCPATDGAAAVLLGPAEAGDSRSVDLLASVQTTGRARFSDYPDVTTFSPTVEAANRAYRVAGITPDKISVVELHDCFTIAELVDTEDLGLLPKGRGGAGIADGLTDFGGKTVVNPSGGLLSKGHPVGATGCGQVYEVVRQLRGEHPNQVPGARLGLTHNGGGTQAVVCVNILRGR